MSNPDYIVQIANIGIPLKNGITIHNIKEFYDQLNTDYSNFKLWFDNNYHYLNKFSDDANNIKILEDYYDFNIDIFISAILEIPTFTLIKNESVTTQKPIVDSAVVNPVFMVAGALDRFKKTTKKDILNFLGAVPKFLFHRNNSNDTLNNINNDKDDKSDKSDKNNKIIKDLSGKKKNRSKVNIHCVDK